MSSTYVALVIARRPVTCSGARYTCKTHHTHSLLLKLSTSMAIKPRPWSRSRSIAHETALGRGSRAFCAASLWARAPILALARRAVASLARARTAVAAAVHQTRTAVSFAYAVLWAGREARRKRAITKDKLKRFPHTYGSPLPHMVHFAIGSDVTSVVVQLQPFPHSFAHLHSAAAVRMVFWHDSTTHRRPAITTRFTAVHPVFG